MSDKPSERAVEIARQSAYEEYCCAEMWENGCFNTQRFAERVLSVLIRAGFTQLTEEPNDER